MDTNPSIETMRYAIATLIDRNCEDFQNITNDPKTALTVLGYQGNDLVLEVKYFCPRLRKYIISHVVNKMIRKHKLISDEEITLFEPFEIKQEGDENLQTRSNTR